MIPFNKPYISGREIEYIQQAHATPRLPIRFRSATSDKEGEHPCCYETNHELLKTQVPNLKPQDPRMKK